jgi:hypothetical protein
MTMDSGSHRYRRPSVSRTTLVVLIVLVSAGLVIAGHFLEKHGALTGLVAVLGIAVLVAAVAWFDAD